jgi:hypothetical protein
MDRLSPRVDYTERRKTRRKKGKCPKSKFITGFCIKEGFHREKKDKEKPFCVLMRTYLPQG